MNFRTRIDFTDRQAKQYEKTGISLSGASTFGLPYSALTTGPDLTMSAITYENAVLQSTYSGNTGTTVYTFGDSRMSIDEGDLVTLTPSNSGNTQYAGPTWAGFDMFTTVDGYTGWTGYSAVTYDLNVVTMEDLGSGAYSGVVQSDFIVYSATSVDWTGSTIWVDVSGITRTDELIVSKNPTIGYVLTCSDIYGKVQFQPVSGGTDTFTTGATLIGSTAYFDRNDSLSAYTLNLSTLTSGLWSAGTGTNSIAANNHNSVSSGVNSVSFGTGATASGDYSFSIGYQNVSSGNGSVAFGGSSSLTGYPLATGMAPSPTSATTGGSFAIGGGTLASGPNSFAAGSKTTASGRNSHAGGENTTASGHASHAEGWNVTASGHFSHAEGRSTTASGIYSHAEGRSTTASGDTSHAEGWSTVAGGQYSHAEGDEVVASGYSAHAEGSLTIAGGSVSHAQNQSTWALGDHSHSSGQNTIASGSQSFVGGYGQGLNGVNSNIASGEVSFSFQRVSVGLLGARADNSVVLGGLDNDVNTDATASSIFGGSGNTIDYSLNSFIGNGVDNFITGSTRSVILGGYLNIISGHTDASIIGGSGNTIDFGIVTDYSRSESIIASDDSLILGGGRIFLGSSINSTITQSNQSAILASSNSIIGNTRNSAILGGTNHVVNNTLNDIDNMVIVGGSGNTINGTAERSVIIGGTGITADTSETVYVPYLNLNYVPSTSSVDDVLLRDSDGTVTMTSFSGRTFWREAGNGNTALKDSKGLHTISDVSTYSMAAGGASNTISATQAAFIGGGATNTISSSSDLAAIIGGWGNTITTDSDGAGVFVGSGHTISTDSDWSAILGGRDNLIDDSKRSVVIGGTGHTLSKGTNSIIIGGINNGVDGVDNSVVIGGSGITADTIDTVYVPDLVIDGLTSTDPLATDSTGRVVAGASDRRLKQNIKSLKNGLDKIKQLRGVEFEWTPESNMGDGKRFGLIAQEVEEVIPDMVRLRSKGDGMLTLNYNEVVPWLIEAVKELSSGLTYISGDTKSEIKTDEFGRWIATPALSSKHMILPEFTPTSTNDERGMLGDSVWDDDYIYIKTNNGWKRSGLENF